MHRKRHWTAWRVLRWLVGLVLAGVFVVTVAGCGEAPASEASVHGSKSSRLALVAAIEQTETLQKAVGRWQNATTLRASRTAADDARDLVTGPHVRFAGDSVHDPDGARIGLLPGTDGGAGLAATLPGVCIAHDILGGAWTHPEARWTDVGHRISQYRPGTDTITPIASRAQQLVAWATLAQRASLSESREFASKAAADVVVVRHALAGHVRAACTQA